MQPNSNCIKRYRWKRIKRQVICCIVPIFGFNLELLVDLTKITPSINTVNISQVQRYRNIIPVSIYWSNSTIAVVLKLLDLYTVWNGQYTIISFIVKVILITKIVSGFKVTFNNHLYLFYCWNNIAIWTRQIN